MLKVFVYFVFALALTTSCSRSLFFQARAKWNAVKLEALAREIQDTQATNYPFDKLWSTLHKKIYWKPSYTHEFIHHAGFMAGNRCGIECDSVDKYALPLSQKQDHLLQKKMSINEIHSFTQFTCPNTYKIGDSSVCFVNTGINFLGFGMDHIIFIDLRKTPRKELCQSYGKNCSPKYCYEGQTFKITDRVYYLTRKHNFYELPGSL